MVRQPWQDEDGRWYDGPNRQYTVTRCGQCGWSEHVTRRRGKIVHSVTCKPVACAGGVTVTVMHQDKV